MRALEPWMMDAVDAMCEGGFPHGLRDLLLAGYGPGSAWEAGTMRPGRLCPNFGREEDPFIDCCSCGVDGCMAPESMDFPTANVFDVVIREYLLATGFLPVDRRFGPTQGGGGEIPF